MSKPQRSLRLEKRSARSLAVLSGAPGEIFFDNDNGTLRVYTDNAGDSIILANRQWVTSNTFDGDYNNLTNKPIIPGVTGLATETYVDDAIAAIPATDLTGLATETYVDDAIAAIPATDLTGLATETFVGTAISNLIDTAPTTLDTLNELAAALGDDANFATTVTTALGLKAPLASPTFTGTVGGITATMVGLGNVTNESKATMFASPEFTGTTTLQQSTEVLNTKTAATGTVIHDFSTGAIFYHSSISANFTANFTNVPTTDNKTISVVLILSQGATAYLSEAVQIDGAAQTILWQGGAAPSGTASGRDIISFTFIRTSSTWTVLGSGTSYS